MKRFLILRVLLLVFSTLDQPRAQNTNDVFLPEHVQPVLYNTRKEADAIDAKAFVDAIASGECRPAELDPEGHWGTNVYGFQLGIRCQTNIFRAGEPAPIAIIIRNTTTNGMRVFSISKGGETGFLVEDEFGNSVQPFVGGVSIYGFKDLSAKHQIKYDHDLLRLIPPRVGTYKIRALQPVAQFMPDMKTIVALTNIYSGVLTVKIIPP
jgi:hypothetical protein